MKTRTGATPSQDPGELLPKVYIHDTMEINTSDSQCVQDMFAG